MIASAGPLRLAQSARRISEAPGEGPTIYGLEEPRAD